MKLKMNTKMMSPEMRRFLPEFSQFVVMRGDTDITSDCTLDVDDKGRAVLSVGKPMERPALSGRPMQAFPK